MTTVTNEIVKNQYQAEGDFTLMATPLPTGEYKDNLSYSGTILFMLPVVLAFFSNLGFAFSQIAEEKNEAQLQNILKRIGYREIINVYRSFIIASISTVFFMIPIGLISLLLVLPIVNPVIGIVFFVIVNLEMWLVDMILNMFLRCLNVRRLTILETFLLGLS